MPGLELDNFAPRLSFFFNASSDLLEEVSKFRAARKTVGLDYEERFNAMKPEAGCFASIPRRQANTLTAQQIDNNIVRVALQALSAVLGGTQSLHTNSRMRHCLCHGGFSTHGPVARNR